MDHSCEKGFVGEGESHLPGEFSGGDSDGDAVHPEVFGGVIFAELDAAEQLAEAGGDGDVFDGVDPEEDDRAFDGGDLSWEAIEGAVDDSENACDECGIVGNDAMKLAGVALGILHGGDDLRRDFGQCRDGADFFDCLLRDGLGIGQSQYGHGTTWVALESPRQLSADHFPPMGTAPSVVFIE